MIRIAPSILSADFARLGEEIRLVEAAGADYIHVDVMDGHFVPNLTIGPPVVAALKKVSGKPLDVHLMITPVEPMLAAFLESGADLVTIHAEATSHLDRALSMIREGGARAGLAFNPGTPVACLEHVLHRVDLVLLMSVNPGFGGQSFIPSVLPKIAAVRRLVEASGRSIEVEVDGGVNASTIAAVARAGADVFVAGSAIFGSGDYAEAIRTLREQAAQ
ncbi:MAG: ribulose-phosphate 3-epimerase [Magnetococcales bacterium]|nr:ribulose-phosphate 3-epimerase [Magnetococcales bacterium]